MAGNGFDGGNDILRGMNLEYDRQNKRLQGTVQELAQKNMMLISIMRAMIRKYSTDGEVRVTKTELESAQLPRPQQPAVFIKNTGEVLHVALSPEGPKEGEQASKLIVLGDM